MSFFQYNFSDLDVVISLLVEEKEKYFYDIIQTQAIHWVYRIWSIHARTPARTHARTQSLLRYDDLEFSEFASSRIDWCCLRIYSFKFKIAMR